MACLTCDRLREKDLPIVGLRNIILMQKTAKSALTTSRFSDYREFTADVLLEQAPTRTTRPGHPSQHPYASSISGALEKSRHQIARSCYRLVFRSCFPCAQPSFVIYSVYMIPRTIKSISHRSFFRSAYRILSILSIIYHQYTFSHCQILKSLLARIILPAIYCIYQPLRQSIPRKIRITRHPQSRFVFDSTQTSPSWLTTTTAHSAQEAISTSIRQ
jgi:hypothetical protein